jgi:hypothetical protein
MGFLKKIRVSGSLTVHHAIHHVIQNVLLNGFIHKRLLVFGTSWKFVVSFMLRPLYSRTKFPLYPFATSMDGRLELVWAK